MEVITQNFDEPVTDWTKANLLKGTCRMLKLTTTLDRAITQNLCYVPFFIHELKLEI